MSMDTLIAGYETGFSSSSVICGDISKPISVYAKNASEWWKIWEYKVGLQINIDDRGFYLETNPMESVLGISDGNMTFPTAAAVATAYYCLPALIGFLGSGAVVEATP